MNNEKQLKRWRSPCPVSRALDFIGHRWSLLILRDMLLGSSKFQQFLASPMSIATNVLSSQLRLLEGRDLIKATLYQGHPPRFAYALTDKGKKTRFRNSHYRRMARIQHIKIQGTETDLFDPV
jgi:DNA-binding HxlR family transcriptional regulator